jgi:hypothetical protein
MPEPQVIKKPGTETGASNPAAPEPVIRTLPERYIGATPGKPPVIREVLETRIKEVVPPKPPMPVAPKKGNRKLTLIVIAGAVVLAGLGTAVYVLLAPAKPIPPPKNTNTNVNLNANVNTNVNIPPPEPVCGNSIVENGEQCDIGNQNGVVGSGCTAGCKLVVVTPEVPNTGVDSDSDGLTDVEETEIYGSDPIKTDTDGDTFNDGNEVAHLYDPMEKAPAKLEDSTEVKKITNQTAGYSVLIPAKWTLSGDGTAQFIATATNGEFLQVIAASKPAGQSLVEWYLAMSPGTSASAVERTRTIQGYDALRSPDRLTTYVDAADGRVFTLTYSFDGQPKLQFRTTYDAFVGGFLPLPVSASAVTQ